MTTAPLVTPTELAIRWRVSKRTIVRLAKDGTLHGVRIGNRWRFTDDEVKVYEAQRDQRDQSRTETAS